MLMAGATANASGYSITNSARFVSGNSAYLTRTPAGSGSRTTWTYSAWVKRATLGTNQCIIEAGASWAGSYFLLRFTTGDQLELDDNAGTVARITTQVFRDVGAWYHIVIKWDTTNSAVTLYVNGIAITAFGTNTGPSASYAGFMNTAVVTSTRNPAGTQYPDMYMANVYFIDGQALTASSFGQTNTSDVWVPKAYSGTYGTNGFLMEFKNSAALGTDTSGNANTFTSSGLTATDQFGDTPTTNYATLNPTQETWTGAVTLTKGNLSVAGAAAAVWNNITATISVKSGKWFWATKPATSGQAQADPFIVNQISRAARPAYPNIDANGWKGSFDDANTLVAQTNGGSTSHTLSPAYAAGDLLLVAFDADNLKVWFGRFDASTLITEWADGSTGWTGNPAAGTNASYTVTGTEFFFGVSTYTGRSGDVDFGQGYLTTGVTIPTGFKALNSSNLPAPAIKDGSAHFQTALHTGTGSALTINQSGNSTFTSDFVWTKGRSGATDHILSNVISGTGKYLKSNATTAETTDAQALTAFGAGSISYGTLAAANTNAATYVDWMWKGGGAGVSNTSGSITSTVSVNTTAGFSVVAFTKGSGDETVGHGLGLVPSLIITKSRTNGINSWATWHSSACVTVKDMMRLQSTGALYTDAANLWGSAVPTSTVFGVSTAAFTGDMVAYCFAPIAGFSAFGSYTGNGSADGPFIYTGFKPAWVMWKNASAAATSWLIKDTSRDTYNVMTTRLFAENANADDVNTSNDLIDYVSNGFKIRSISGAQTNGSGNTIIYAAFASNPFGGSGAAPATAR